MSVPTGATTSEPRASSSRRFAVAAILGGVLFLALWLFVAVSFMSAAIFGLGVGGVVFVAGLMSDVVESVLDMLASAIFALFAVFGILFGALTGIFGS